MKVYLSGPMTGYPEYNYPAFAAASKWLREVAQFEVESPHENPSPETPLPEDDMWEYYMKLCKKQVERCEAIVLMAGWPESRGARQELTWSVERGMNVIYLDRPLGGPAYKIIHMSERNLG
jgi:hypothetical protein